MAKKLIEIPKEMQFERVYDTEDCIAVWKYDLTKFTNGPVSVELKWKPTSLAATKEVKRKKLKKVVKVKPIGKKKMTTKKKMVSGKI